MPHTAHSIHREANGAGNEILTQHGDMGEQQRADQCRQWVMTLVIPVDLLGQPTAPSPTYRGC